FNALTGETDSTGNDFDAARRKKLTQALGPNLRGLAQFANDAEENLSTPARNGGEINNSLSIPTDVGEPSEISTERVQRVPLAENSSPLLSPEEPIGNLATGEEGTYNTGSYGPLSGQQRSLSLMSLFNQKPSQRSSNASESGGSTSNDVGGAGTTENIQTGQKALGAASPFVKYLSKYLSTGSVAPNDYSNSQSSAGAEYETPPANWGDYNQSSAGAEYEGPPGGGSTGGGFDWSMTGPVLSGAGNALALAQLFSKIADGTAEPID